MSDEFVSYERENDIAVIGIDRAAKRNAISNAVIAQLEAAVRRANNEAKVGIVFGHGDNFSAGLDLAEMAAQIQNGRGPAIENGNSWHSTFDLIARGQIPWIAALKGACVGGGLELASACHIRVADASTYFALPEGRRGLFIGGGGSVRIQRLMGYARMADMMLTGRVLSAEQGERANLCQYVVEAGLSLETARTLAATIATNAPMTNWAICTCLPRVNDLSHNDGLFIESLISAAVVNDDGKQRLDEFLTNGANKVQRPQ